MKNLIFINGTMGVGKTATSKTLLKLLPNCVFLDGDWCWDSSPFIVNDETKCMVEKNIGYLLNNFLTCSAYENIVFCWVMHEKHIIDTILSLIPIKEYTLFKFSIICAENVMRARLQKDIDNGIREPEIFNKTIPRLQRYLEMDTIKIDVSNISPKQAAYAMSSYINPII